VPGSFTSPAATIMPWSVVIFENITRLGASMYRMPRIVRLGAVKIGFVPAAMIALVNTDWLRSVAGPMTGPVA
jgi:hypothetical protein